MKKKESIMKRAFHYSELDNFRNVEKEGILKASSPLIPEIIAKDAEIILPDERYLFILLDSPEPESWVKIGWIEHLLCNYLNNRYVLLSFDVSNDDVYVLDATPTYEIWKMFDRDYALAKSSPQFKTLFRSYVESKTPLAEYKKQFKIPEWVITKDIPLSEITIEKIVDSPINIMG